MIQKNEPKIYLYLSHSLNLFVMRNLSFHWIFPGPDQSSDPRLSELKKRADIDSRSIVYIDRDFITESVKRWNFREDEGRFRGKILELYQKASLLCLYFAAKMFFSCGKASKTVAAKLQQKNVHKCTLVQLYFHHVGIISQNWNFFVKFQKIIFLKNRNFSLFSDFIWCNLFHRIFPIDFSFHQNKTDSL